MRVQSLIRNSAIAASLLCLLPLSVNADDNELQALIERLGIRESDTASRDIPSWSKPRKISFLLRPDAPASGLGSEQWVREVADGVEIHFLSFGPEGIDTTGAADSDAYFGWCIPSIIEAAANLRYLHLYSAGIDRCAAIPGIRDRGMITSNSAKAASETIADHSIAMMFTLTRNLHMHHTAQLRGEWDGISENAPETVAIGGKTMLVLGLGGIGTQVARRAHGLGMRVIGTRNSSRDGPDFVDHVGLSDEMLSLAAQADVVVNALPLTNRTKYIVNGEFFDAMRNGSYYVSVGRGATTDTDALIAALKSGKLSGAGLDVTDPEPLPRKHELWRIPNVLITPHSSSASSLSVNNTTLIARENLRRYIQGEQLLNIVDFARGY